MVRKRYSTKLFYKYYNQWIKLYKEGAVRPVTLDKYYLTYVNYSAINDRASGNTK